MALNVNIDNFFVSCNYLVTYLLPEDLRYIKYLNISDCKYVDDWCFERIMPISDTLVVLDVSGCPLVTERGLATVHKFPYVVMLLVICLN